MPIAKYDSAQKAIAASSRKGTRALYEGNCKRLLAEMKADTVDLTITSPPYCIGKAYESESTTTADFIETQRQVIPQVARVTKTGGSICWQTGYHVTDGTVFPLDYAIYEILQGIPGFILRNRIIWSFGHGLHSSVRFSGRHEVILWFTKGNDYNFALDEVRVPQKYPGKRYYKGANKGQFSGNPLGKNPGDVWEIPNVKANHVEKTTHPCQFPVALAQRLIKALCPSDGIVFDPFAGVGSTGAAAALEKRRFLGAEINGGYCAIALKRMEEAANGRLAYRADHKPIHVPSPTDAVARRPAHFEWKDSLYGEQEERR